MGIMILSHSLTLDTCGTTEALYEQEVYQVEH